MATDSKQPKFTPDQVQEHIQKIQQVIEKHKRENKGEHFVAVTPGDIERKLQRVNSPIIVSQGWSNTTLGGTMIYTLGIYNPDPTSAFSLEAQVWIGSGHGDPNVGTFLLNADTRFPRLTQPNFPGLQIASGASATLSFSLKIPNTVEKANYIGNSCLMQFNWTDIGTYLDRSAFVFCVS
jgi:hypothetical protein